MQQGRPSTFRLIAGAVLLVVVQVTAVRPAAAAANSPTVTPATGGGGVPLINGAVVDPDAIGYDTAEFLISGEAHSHTFCGAFGVTIPFTAEQLAALYPTHQRYVKAFRRATRDAVRSKFLLKQDAKRLNRAAKKSGIGQ